MKRTWIAPARSWRSRFAASIVVALAGNSLVAHSGQERAVPSVPAAQYVRVPGGTSPDKRLEIRVLEIGDFTPSNYVVVVVDTASGRVVKELGASGGYYTYASVKGYAENPGFGAGALVTARWHPSSRFFALTDFGTKTSNSLSVYEVKRSDVVEVPLPAYEHNALGRAGAVTSFRSEITELKEWKGDVLVGLFQFDVSTEPDRFAVSFALRLSHGPGNVTSVSLESMGKATRLPCC